ncbi:BLOC1S4 [Bugula neritina]|uniref:BLOC1S4 n=1 Tax=Bugula neritina TaxID=10212 RepID=A0A7J7K7I5_BUGNE|nr:BLOC1S4 [Bugula neritina]
MENSNVETPKANPTPEFEPLASQISELVTVDSTAEEKKLNDEIDLMLHKISEFMEILEMIRSDTNMCVNSTLPLITEKSRALEQTFDRIDKLEHFLYSQEEDAGSPEQHREKSPRHESCLPKTCRRKRQQL